MSSLRDELLRFVAPMKRQIVGLIGRAVLQALDDTTALQLVKVSIGPGETIDGVERVQNYGFTSVPEAPSEAVILYVGGNRKQAIVIAMDSSSTRKKNLAPGDSCVYNGKTGDYILLNADGVKIHSSGKVVVDAGTVELSNAGTLSALMTDEMVSIFNEHVHATVTSLGVPTPPASPIIPGVAVTSKTKAG